MHLYTHHTDEQLIALLHDSDAGAFTEIYRRYWDKLYLVALNRSGDAARATEIVQDIFYHLWRKRQTLRLTHTLNTYLAAAVKFEIINHLSKDRTKRKYLNEVAAAAAPQQGENYTQQQFDFDNLREELTRHVKALPDKCRLVYQLHQEQGLTKKEISEQLGIAAKTVEAHLATALRKLRRALLHIFLPFL